MAELADAQSRYAVEIATKRVGMGDLETKKRKRGPIDTRQYQRLQNRVKKFKVDAQEWKKKHKPETLLALVEKYHAWRRR